MIESIALPGGIPFHIGDLALDIVLRLTLKLEVIHKSSCPPTSINKSTLRRFHRECKFGPYDYRGDNEHNGYGLVVIRRADKYWRFGCGL